MLIGQVATGPPRPFAYALGKSMRVVSRLHAIAGNNPVEENMKNVETVSVAHLGGSEIGYCFGEDFDPSRRH